MTLALQLILMPLIGALIGWGTNLLAIKLIFRPLNPIKIPILGIEIQGLIPKRRFDISRNIGEALEDEIISPEDIIDKLASENAKVEIISYIKNTVTNKMKEKLPTFIPSALKGLIFDYFGDLIDQNGSELFDEMKLTLAQKATDQLKLKEMVEEKINSFDLEELEELIIKLSRQELKQIEVLGGVIGFFIGLIQAGFSYCIL